MNINGFRLMPNYNTRLLFSLSVTWMRYTQLNDRSNAILTFFLPEWSHRE